MIIISRVIGIIIIMSLNSLILSVCMRIRRGIPIILHVYWWMTHQRSYISLHVIHLLLILLLITWVLRVLNCRTLRDIRLLNMRLVKIRRRYIGGQITRILNIWLLRAILRKFRWGIYSGGRVFYLGGRVFYSGGGRILIIKWNMRFLKIWI